MHFIHTAWSCPGGCFQWQVLRVDISNGMSWNSYVARITSRANTTLDFIKRSIKTKNVRVRETAHNTLARPQLKYAAPIWDSHAKQKIFQLEKSPELSGGPPVITITGQA